jgi:hypothetical protein
MPTGTNSTQPRRGLLEQNAELPRIAVAALLLLLAAPVASLAAIEGRVVNRTTGQPAGGIILTLLKFDAGMDPVEEVRTDAGGSFAFQKPLVGAGGNPVPGMIRAEYQGVSYSEMIPPAAPSTGLEIGVYSVNDTGVLSPRAHIIIFEPGAGELVVNQNFAFLNDTNPPQTFRDPTNGTLRFYLPPAAKGIVQVRTAGPQRMPLRGFASPTSEEDIYSIDFPLKPGENSIDVTYVVPYNDGGEFEGRLLYDGLSTRMAVPAGVSLEGEGLVSMGQEPRTRASLYELPPVASFRVSITGQGRLDRPGGDGGMETTSSAGGEIRIADAPVSKELYWILGLTAAVLTVGFYYLYSANASTSAADASEAPEQPARKPAASAVKASRQALPNRKQ